MVNANNNYFPINKSVATDTKSNWILNYSLGPLLVSVLIATAFFDDPHLFFYKRIIYVCFLYFALYQLYLFNYNKKEGKLHVPMPSFYHAYIQIFIIFIVAHLAIDFFNPRFSLISLLNQPAFVLAVVPVFAFKVGYQTTDEDKIFNILYYISLAYLIFFIFPIKGNNIYNAAITCYATALPLFAFALYKKKKLIYSIFLLPLGFLLSEFSESRTIILRILIFLGLMFALTFFKKYSSLKILVILFTCFITYEVLTDLQNFLDIFVSSTGDKKFDDSDTRTFLYQELFDDLKPHELITGRGFQGTYFSPYFMDQMQQGIANGDSFIRGSIEVGFLQLLLKGGFIYYFLYLTPLIISCYKGLSSTKSNRLSYSISIFLLTEIIIMFLENIPAFSFQFFLIFFLAGFSLRKFDDQNLKSIRL